MKGRSVLKKLGTCALAVSLAVNVLSPVSLAAADQGNIRENSTAGVNVSVDESGVTIGNGCIERVFDIDGQHIRTASLNNKRIGETLVPQEGSEDFYIRTLAEAKGEEVLPQQELNRTGWTGQVTGSGKDNVVDASKMFDGNDTTETDYYVTGSDYPYTLTVDLGEEKTFQSFSYQKRTGNANVLWGINGTVGKYRLQVSTDGTDWQDAGNGEFTRDDYKLHQVGNLFNVADLVYGNFKEAYTARYVRLISESGALSAEKTFNGAEFRLYEDSYVPQEMPSTEIRSGELVLEDVNVSDTENGGKKVDFEFEPYTVNDVTWDFTYVVVAEAEDHFMRSYVEATADNEAEAKIDYVDLDHFVLGDDVKDLWYRPDNFKVSEGPWNFLHTEMLLGEPIYVNGMFFGSEFPATDTKVENKTMQVRYYSGKSLAKLREENRLTTDGKFVSWPNVAGAAQGTDPDVVQIDFFAYIDSIATKTTFRKQYNSWYDNRMGITDERIASNFYGTEKGLAAQGYEPLDCYVADDGWNNYNDPTYTGIDSGNAGNSYNRTGFWEINDKFPNELYPASEMTAKFDSKFGLWLGPQGGYDLYGTFSQYIESMGTGYVHPTAALGNVICTGSKKYITNLTTLFTDYQKRFDIDYWKLDGFASRPCVQTDHDHMAGGYNNMYFTSDMWENWTDAFEAMRAQRAEEGKGLYINATCYTISSPWMLQWVNTIWQHNAGDLEKDGTNGGSAAQQMISGRDNIYFRNVREAQIQLPLKNVYNHEPIYGASAGVTMNTTEFRQYLMGNAVRGVSFWELYFSPSMMDEEKWQVTADVLNFAEENEHILQHAKLFGNAPKTRSVYGYSSWDGAEGIISFRNPTSAQKTYTLTLNELVGVTAEVQNVHQFQILPYTASLGDAAVSYGDELTVTLAPYEERIYQFTNEKNEAPEIVYGKVMDAQTVRVKFDQRVEDVDSYTVNGEKAEATLLNDYRTVELKTASAFAEGETVKVAVHDVSGINGAALNKELSLVYYENGTIAEVKGKADLEGADAVEEQVFERGNVNFLSLDGKSYELSAENSFDKETKDFTISMLLQTGSKDAVILQQEGAEIGIDAEGFLTYEDGTVSLTSKENVTTVAEKAYGTFGTDEYVPTSAEVSVKGRINDGNKHTAAVVRELNGMVKLYVDGELRSSAYEHGKMTEFAASSWTLGSRELTAQIADLEIVHHAVGYDELAKAYAAYGLSASDTKLDKSGWTASADSEEKNAGGGEGPATYAIDDNTSTRWHTEYVYTKPVCPHWLKIDLGKVSEFDKLEYVSRNGNGSPRDYTLEVSRDGEVWEQIKEGTLPKDGTTVLEFAETQSARYVRLNIKTSYGVNAANENIFGSVAEISLYVKNPPATDYAALNAVIREAGKVSAADYTEESFTAFEEVFAQAKQTANDVNAAQKEADAAAAALTEAIAGLMPRTTYRVTVENGTLKDGTTEGRFVYNTKVTVTAEEEQNGQKFAGWKAGEAILSTDREYTFFAGSDLTLTAVYDEVEVKAAAYLQNVTVTKRADTKSDIRYLAQLVIPEDCRLVNAGLVWSNKGVNTEEALQVPNAGADGVKLTKISKISNTYQFSVTINGVPENTKVPGRIFAEVVDGEGQHYVYSAILTGEAK